jgi:hypothetical protein
MSLTSYRAAPPRAGSVGVCLGIVRFGIMKGVLIFVLCKPGNGLLSRALRRSTIGAKVFNGRVRDGIGFYHLAEPPG